MNATGQFGSGVTLHRKMLGARLRRLRQAAGLDQEKAGYEIRAGVTKVSRMESGLVGFKIRDVEDLLTLYGVTDVEERTMLLDLAREANEPAWWNSYADLMLKGFSLYVGLEDSASVIRNYEPYYVSGLLQTEDYMRALFSANRRRSDEEISQLVSLRVGRQARIAGDNPARLWTVIDESAFRRTVGGPEVMRDQVHHIIEMAARPHISVQVVPFGAGVSPAGDVAFWLLRFPEAELPDVVYTSHLTGGVLLDKRDQVEQYVDAMQRLATRALSPDRSIAFLEQVKRELSP